MPTNYRYTTISREARATGEHLLDVTRRYENLIVEPRCRVARLGGARYAEGKYDVRTRVRTLHLEASIVFFSAPGTVELYSRASVPDAR